MIYDAFAIKKQIGSLLQIEYGGVLLLVMAAILLITGKRRKGALVMLAALALMGLPWLPFFGEGLIRVLESRIEPMPGGAAPHHSGIAYVVVLDDFPQALPIWRAHPGSKLIVSAPTDRSRLLNDALRTARNKDEIIPEHRARDTEEQALFTADFLRGKRFILVTWAGHMYRATRIFRLHGLDPIPAPVLFTSDLPKENPFKPSALGLRLTRQAVHEYLGILWCWVKTVGAVAGIHAEGSPHAGLFAVGEFIGERPVPHIILRDHDFGAHNRDKHVIETVSDK